MKQQFITYRELNDTGLLCYYICQKAHPNYVGIVSVGQMVDTLASAPVGGYNLYVNFNGCLHGNYVPSYNTVIDDITHTMWDMATWFYENRVMAEPKKYSKFKIIRNDSISD